MKQMMRLTLLVLVLALALAPSASASSAALARAVKIIAQMETNGNYASVSNDTNASPSVGIMQWNNGRAVSLLKKIIADDVEAAQNLLGEALYNQLSRGGTSVWSGVKLSAAQRSAVGALLKTGNGIKRQDAQARSDVSAYIEKARGLGIREPNALVYYADIAHQTGTGAVKKYAVKAAEIAGGYEKVTLKSMYQAALVYATYTKARRTKVYNMLVADPVKEESASAPKLPESIAISPSGTQTLLLGDTLKLAAAVAPSSAACTTAWTTSNAKVATVSGGVVTPKKAGKAVVSVKTNNGKKASVNIVVKPVKVKRVAITGEVLMKRGQKQKLSAVCEPANATNQAVRWRSSKSRIAAVNSKGVVLARRKGKAVIYCMTKDGTKKVGRLAIRVG